jgi:hypothetical protein
MKKNSQYETLINNKVVEVVRDSVDREIMMLNTTMKHALRIANK